MKILSIETSCDETAVSIVEAKGDIENLTFDVASNLVLSQIKIHEKFGGVFPSVAKREHSKNLVPLLKQALVEAGLFLESRHQLEVSVKEKIEKDLAREPELFKALIELFESTANPQIDLIAVTYGPGLEPALWVGINAGKVLGEVWGIPVMPINHMEGHISSVLADLKTPVEFPALALLISGGHTELVLVSDWLKYQVIGQTRDDAVGEAYDKVARMLGLPYPGGPQIAHLAEEGRRDGSSTENFVFPRPMIKSDDYDFSFSGLKTSVLYTIRKISDLNDQTKKEIALAFEDAVVETLLAKTAKTIDEFAPKTLIIAGGVIANKTIRKAFEELVSKYPETKLLIPNHEHSTDNALMIALAAYVGYIKNPNQTFSKEFKAEGNARLS